MLFPNRNHGFRNRETAPITEKKIFMDYLFEIIETKKGINAQLLWFFDERELQAVFVKGRDKVQGRDVVEQAIQL